MLRAIGRRLLGGLLDPMPLRSATLGVLKSLGIGSYQFHLEQRTLPRAHYAYIMFEGARLAKRLGFKRISVIEFGVAGGNGLVNMEYHAEKIEELLGVTVDIYGFDTGVGLPPPEDYRDLPYIFKEGFFRMDQAALKARLKRSKLIIGDARDT